MGPMIIILLAFFVVITVIVVVVLKKTDPKNQDSSENDHIKEAQQFLPFDDISENMIMLPNQQFRAVLECSCLNYQLKTSDERNQIEMSFQRFLNTINFPISIFLQTKTIDNTARLKQLDNEIKAAVQDHPGLKAYADQFRRDMEDINSQIGNSHQKKRYIIVTYDDVQLLDNLSKEEQAHYAAKEIRNRCNLLKDNLEGVGINSHMMSTQELIELVYSCYYRDDFSYAESIANKDAFALIVNGKEDLFEGLSKEETVKLMCKEVMNQIQMNNLELTEGGAQLMQVLTKIKKAEVDNNA